MAQLLYTPIGEMNRVIDFWDQRPDTIPGTSDLPPPELFLSGVFAKIESLWTTTQAKRLSQQVLPETTHKITIRYTPRLKTRMFILYADPDTDAPRRFDIDSINDPDEMKVELQILAIERNDGQ